MPENTVNRLAVLVYPSVQEALDRPYSYVVLATKALPEIAPTSSILSPLLSPKYMHPQPAYVLFQNGLGIENDLYNAASKLVRDGKPRILSCTLHIGTNLLSDNVVQHNVLDRIVMGLYKHGNFTNVSQTPEEIELLNDFGGMLIAGGSEVTLVPEIQRHRFRKNFWNLAFSSVATLSRYPLRAIFQQPRVETTAVPIIHAIMLENLAVGRAIGLDEDAIPSSVIEDTIKSTGNFHRKPDSKHKASMLLDCETGRPMEIEVIVGEVLRKAKELGVETPLACGIPIQLKTDDWKGKKVVLFSIPGAFTPTCHVNHLPGFLKKYDEFKAKGVDVIAVVAANDPFVMSGWGRVEGVQDKILCLSDTSAQWSKSLGLSIDLSERGLGVRTARYALIINDLKVEYTGVESAPGVTVSGADAVLASL
ncbi:6-phosphogluconate dehydrogenase C-terminal domain-like protein [Sanghuangporus baumii]|uniref:Putative peroxiredoxin n=1 Tax=Sanghuangporus baumii TaxID=108892 RepID=A0A9Q5I0J7_SANBA|nr:6-phosphogluconate dehydrogenase C-terminal domain-like protein [Sanghuangporus baumii]